MIRGEKKTPEWNSFLFTIGSGSSEKEKNRYCFENIMLLLWQRSSKQCWSLVRGVPCLCGGHQKTTEEGDSIHGQDLTGFQLSP